jgi:hypothetical protein
MFGIMEASHCDEALPMIEAGKLFAHRTSCQKRYQQIRRFAV